MEEFSVFHNEADVSEFIREQLQESMLDPDAVESFLKSLPEKVWHELLVSFESVIREELQALIADAITDREEETFPG